MRLGRVRGTFGLCGRVVGLGMTLWQASQERRHQGMDVQYKPNLPGPGSDSEVIRLAAEVHRAARQTGRVSQAVTRVAAEVQCLAGEVGALVAQCGQGLVPGIAPGARSVPDDRSSR